MYRFLDIDLSNQEINFIFNLILSVTPKCCEQRCPEKQEEGGEASDHCDGDVLPLLAPHPAHPSAQISWVV